MTNEQITALRNHCRFGFETADRKFCSVLPENRSLVLSVNSGYE